MFHFIFFAPRPTLQEVLLWSSGFVSLVAFFYVTEERRKEKCDFSASPKGKAKGKA